MEVAVVKIPATGKLIVKTRNNTYIYDADAKTIQGGAVGDQPLAFRFYNEEATEIGVGMSLVGITGPVEDGKLLRTSVIVSVELVPPDQRRWAHEFTNGQTFYSVGRNEDEAYSVVEGVLDDMSEDDECMDTTEIMPGTPEWESFQESFPSSRSAKEAV